jgi:hypothetical protein
MEEPVHNYVYTFVFADQRRITFTVALDAVSQKTSSCPLVPPAWALLRYHQCPPCPLHGPEHLYCPVALAVADLVTTFKDTASYVRCTVSCVSPERTVIKETTVQVGLSSILGLLMATSGCPVMDYFKPLARFHLPFASVEEAIFRAVSVYMLRFYYRQDRQQGDVFRLDDIKKHYGLVKQVNKGLLQRIRSITDRDADNNAIITLTSLSQILEMEIDANLESLQYLFVDK